nr:hypothetical protein [Pantoea agglomerans]
MPAGTIALTNNSTAVTGSGTSFTTELKANDFIVAVVGGVTYTLGVQSVNSATGVTLITAYNGPAASGVAWTAVPNAALVGITAQVAADVAKAIRGLNLDKANWQQIFSGTGNVTVTLPDGSQYTGPAWSTLVASLNAKASNGANSDITSLSGLKTALSVSQGGSGATTAAAARTNFGVGYSNSAANPGGGVYRLFMTDDSGRMFITRRFNVTAKANSATAFSYGWKDDGAGTFVGYPGCSVMGESGNSANFKVGTESLTSTGVSGFIHNTGSTDLSVWLTFIVVGMKA